MLPAACVCVVRGAGGFDYFSHKYSVNGNVFDAVVRLLLIAYCCADSVLTRAAPRSCVTAPLDIHNTRQTFPGPATSTRHKHRDASRDRHDWIAVLHHLFIYIQCISGDPKSHCLQVYCLDSGPLSPLYSGMSFILF